MERRMIALACVVWLTLVCASVRGDEGSVYVSWRGYTPEEGRMIRESLATPETVQGTIDTVNRALSRALGVEFKPVDSGRRITWHVAAGSSEAHRIVVRVAWDSVEGSKRRSLPIFDDVKADLLHQFLTPKKRSGFLGEQTPMPELSVIVESQQRISRTLERDYFERIVSARLNLDYEPGRLITAASSSSSLPVPWHLDRLDQATWPPASNTYPSFDIGGQRDVTVAIVDGGVDPSHPRLSGRVETLNYGGDFDALPRNSDYHGTHVAGIVAGLETGVAREMNGIKLLDVRVLDADGNGDFSNLIEGLMAFVDYCTDVLSRRPDAQFIINMSLGGSASSSDISGTRAELELALQLCNATAVAAAGNENSGSNTFYPAMIPGVIGVGASTTTDRRASFSNYNTVVDVFAPGVDILSAVPTSFADDGLAYLSGTSMAAPVVSGALAILTTQCPRATRMACRQQRFQDAALPNAMISVPASTTRRLVYMGPSVSVTPTAPSPRAPVTSDALTTAASFCAAYLVACALIALLFHL